MGSSSKGYLLVRERFLGFDQYHFKILSSGLQCLLSIRAWVSDPQIIFFGPAAPLHHSSVGASPSNYPLRASSASASFECGRQSLELSSLGRQRLYFTRVRALVPQIIFFGLAVPLHYSSAGVSPSNCLFWASTASTLLELGVLDPSIRIFRPLAFFWASFPQSSISGYQRSPLKIPEFWWQYTSSDAVCQIRR
jgi:hypothetical protein